MSLSLPALAQEGGDEDAGVQVECGMPPAVREVQDLQETPVGSRGSGWGAWGPLQPLDSPPRGTGCTPAGAGLVAGWDRCAGARPASSRWGGSVGFYPAGTETNAGKHRGHIPSQFLCGPSGSAPGGLPHTQGHLLGACFSPVSLLPISFLEGSVLTFLPKITSEKPGPCQWKGTPEPEPAVGAGRGLGAGESPQSRPSPIPRVPIPHPPAIPKL